MDLSFLQLLIPDVAKFFNLDPATVIFYLTLVVLIANLVGRLIPDDVTGFMGTVRNVAKVLGAYTPNRITSGVSVNDVARAAITVEPELAKIPGIVEDVEEVVDIVKAFPGLDNARSDPKSLI